MSDRTTAAPLARRTRRAGAAAALALVAVLLGLVPAAPSAGLAVAGDPVAAAAGTADPAAGTVLGEEDGWLRLAPRLSTPWTDEVGPDNALPEYPRPQMTRERWQSLNGVWQFAAAGPADPVPVGTELAERILVPYPVESALSGIMRHEDRMWYRRTFEVPQAWGVGDGGQRLQLHFDAIDYLAVVWVNGVRVASHVGGFDRVSVDVTDHLVAGENELVVGVADTTERPSPVQAAHALLGAGDGMAAVLDLAGTGYQPVGKQRWLRGGIYYTESSGIWQSVWMEPTPAAHVTRLDLTPDLPGEALDVIVRTAGTTPAHEVEVVATAEGLEVGRVTGAPDAELRLPIPDPRPWSPDDPFLYDLEVRLLDGAGAVVDAVDGYSGMRSIELCPVDGVTRICLNGEPTPQLGPLDQGYWPDGIYTAPTDEALRYDLELTRDLGFTMTRKHIKVEPDRFYHHADQLGLLVWQDMPSMQALTRGYPPPAAQLEFERQLEVMVDTHRSWTSIVAWVPFNEGWGEWSLEGTARIAEEVMADDPSRLVDANSGAPCCHSWGDSGAGHIFDDHTYPGPGSPALFADRASVDGEYGGYGLVVPGHQWGGDFSWGMTDSPEALTSCIVGAQRRLAREVQRGVSAGVYTQITDVEDELNGFATYDRQVVKVDVERIRAVNEAIIAGRPLTEIGATPPDGGFGEASGAWAFDEGSGQVAADSSGAGNDGTLQGGAVFGPGHRGTGVVLDGSTAHVSTGATVVDTAGDFTVSAWVRMTAPGSAYETFVSEDGEQDSAFFLQYAGPDGRFAFSTTAGRALAPEAPVAGRWYHLVGVRTADAMTLYVDGRLAARLDTCVPTQATGELVIGRARYQGGPVDHANGTVDDVRTWARALSPADVAALHEATRVG